ncbi:MAG: hypothetical protein ACO1OB_10550 [Archangium sp.]
MSFRAVVLLSLCSCVTSRGSLVDDAKTCDSFAEFDARAREQLDALVSEAPGDQLVKETARINSARRACAKHVLGGLRERREEKGLNDVQTELDAMTASYGAAFINDTLGDDATQLKPLIEEARQRTSREASAAGNARRDDAELANLKVDAPSSTGPSPELPKTMCAEATACMQVDCVVERADPGDAAVRRELEKAARECLDSKPDVTRLAALLTALEPWSPSGAHTDVLRELETRRLAVWPKVEGAKMESKPGLAAQLAAPFADVPSVAREVKDLRAAALSRHQARAKEVANVEEAKWLQLKLVEQFGGEKAPELSSAGRWDTARWRCEATKPTELPSLPRGLDVKWNVRCEQPKAAPKDDELRTFELRQMKVLISLTSTCAGQTTTTDFTVQEPGSEAFPDEAFRHELEVRVPEIITACGRRHQLQSTASCTLLRKLGAADLIKKFVEHWRFTAKWEPCFTEWFEATEGAQLPVTSKTASRDR